MIHFHRYKPVKAFTTTIVRDMSKPSETVVRRVESYTGYQCSCGKRKIRERDTYQSATTTQEAYDWLNGVAKKAEILRMVK